MTAPTLITNLLEKLSEKEVKYCHWKSNCALHEVLSGETDVDLLISFESVDRFHNCIASLGFKEAYGFWVEESHSIRHFYGLDNTVGRIVHLHVYYKLVTGGSFLKPYRIPVDRMLLDGVLVVDGMPVPHKQAELVLLVIRKTLECGSFLEGMMIQRELEGIRREFEWLLKEGEEKVIHGERGALDLLSQWFPTVNSDLFLHSLLALRSGGSKITLFRFGRRMAKCLKMYAAYSGFVSAFLRMQCLVYKVYKRFVVKKRTHQFVQGGSVIAVVGPEATGKSTLVQTLSDWFGEHFRVVNLHAGKPPSSWITCVPNLLMPALRKMLPNFRSGNVDADLEGGRESRDLSGLKLFIYALRSLMIAYDRRKVLVAAFREATRGAIVICDRYPSPSVRAMDSAQLDPSHERIARSGFYRWLAMIEQSLYARIPPPNLVLQLYIPVDVAVKRNIERRKVDPEDEEYLRRRHMQSQRQNYEKTTVINVDTNEDLAMTILKIKRIVWRNF